MSEISVSKSLFSNYEGYYNGPSLWRRLGALDKADNIVSICNNYPHGRILEIGAGDGSVLKCLSDIAFGDSLYALEISPSAVETIKERNIERLSECRLFSGYEVPYDDNLFDIVILSHVIEHLEYPRKMLYEAQRVGSLVFVEVPLEETVRLKMDYVPDTVGHINSYSLKTIRRLLQTSNLEILSQSITNPSFRIYQYQFGKQAFMRYFPKKLLLKTMPQLACSIFTYHCSLLAKKAKGTIESGVMH